MQKESGNFFPRTWSCRVSNKRVRSNFKKGPRMHCQLCHAMKSNFSEWLQSPWNHIAQKIRCVDSRKDLESLKVDTIYAISETLAIIYIYCNSWISTPDKKGSAQLSKTWGEGGWLLYGVRMILTPHSYNFHSGSGFLIYGPEPSRCSIYSKYSPR